MTEKTYTVIDVINAEYMLEPLVCMNPECKVVGDVVYLQYIGDGCCEVCGEWQLEFTETEL